MPAQNASDFRVGSRSCPSSFVRKADGTFLASAIGLQTGANMSRYKCIIGDALNSRHDARRATEVAIAVKSLNRMREFGQAKFVRVA